MSKKIYGSKNKITWKGSLIYVRRMCSGYGERLHFPRWERRCYRTILTVSSSDQLLISVPEPDPDPDPDL
jgi:hypothetical protein